MTKAIDVMTQVKWYLYTLLQSQGFTEVEIAEFLRE